MIRTEFDRGVPAREYAFLAAEHGPELPFQRGDQVELAGRMLARLHAENGTLIVGDGGELFRYGRTSGLWTVVARGEQSRIAQTFAGAAVAGKSEPLRVSAFDVRGAMTLAYDQVAEPGYFDTAPGGLAFANGFVSVSKTGIELTSHSPAHRARHGFPFDYVHNPSIPSFLRFLDDLFRDDVDKNQKIAALQEHAGASLLGIATTYQKCVICVGSGDDGKSALAKILLECFPSGTVEAVPPQEFREEYWLAMLAGTLLNVVAELPAANTLASEAFTAIVAGDLTAGRTLRKAPFSYKPRAGHLLLADRLPKMGDQTHCFWRRFLIIRFNRCFTGDAARDPNIAERILNAERAGVLSWMIDGARRLVAQNGYTIPASHNVELALWQGNRDPIATFVDESTSPAPRGTGTLASALYGAYRTWATEKGHEPVSSTKFGTRLRKLKHYSRRTNRGKLYPLVMASGEAPGGTTL
jgi:P4 family phage/plasmid primase-like protien